MNAFLRFGLLLGGILWTASAACAGTGIPGDQDADGDVDLGDCSTLYICFSGDGQRVPDACPVDPALFDLDADGDIDLGDYELFHRCLSGPGGAIPDACSMSDGMGVTIAGPSSLEDGASSQLTATVSGAMETVTFEWSVVAGSAAFDDPTVFDPTVCITGQDDVTLRVTATDSAFGDPVQATVEHTIAIVAEEPFTFQVFAGDDHPVEPGDPTVIDLEGAYFDPGGCDEYENYWEWILASAPPGAEGWFNKPHRLGTPAHPVRFTLLNSVPGDYVFTLYGYSPCSEDEDTDTVVVHIGCQADSDCDNGLFCDGAATCDLTDPGNVVCVDGAVPCAKDQVCNEDTDECESPLCETLDLTFSNDMLTGTSGDCKFDGSRDLESGVLLTTVNNGDVLDGGLGTNTLNAEITATVTPQLLKNIQIFNIVDLTGVTFNFTNADSATTVNNNNPEGAFTAANISTALTNIGMTNGLTNFTVTVDDQALTAGDDACTLTLNGVTDGGTQPDITIQPDVVASGYETITIHSTGPIDNNIDSITDGNGNSLATVMITGDRGLTVDQPFDATVTTVDGSAASGDLDLTLPNANVTVTGGSGDDTFRFNGNFDANDTVDGGADSGNSDLLVSTDEDFTGTTTDQTNVVNIETLVTTDQLAGNLNVTHWGANKATIAGKDGTARTLTIPIGGTIEVTNDVGANDLDVELSGADGTNDSFTLRLNGVAATGADCTGNIDSQGFENMTLMSDGTAQNDDNNYTLADIRLNQQTGTVETLTITGSQNLKFTGAIIAETIDASALTGIFDNSAGTGTGATTITTGTGADRVDGSTGADVISTGDGNDRIEGLGGSDLCTGGTGDNTYDFNGITAADTDTITDFDADTNSSSNDLMVFDVATLNGLIGTLSDTSDNDIAATNDPLYKALATDGSTVSNADITGIIGDYTNAADAFANRLNWTITYAAVLDDNDAILLAYTSGANVRIAYAESNGAGTASSDSLGSMVDIVILQGVSLSNLDSTDFGLFE